MPERPSWDDYFMSIAEAVKARSTCLTRQIGAILVKDKRIIATGYNGTPKGLQHCNEGGCNRCAGRTPETSGKNLDSCACSHAEENAIVQTALHGNSSKDATIYTTYTPCTTCAKMIINSGISRIVAKKPYPDDLGTELLKQANVELVILE